MAIVIRSTAAAFLLIVGLNAQAQPVPTVGKSDATGLVDALPRHCLARLGSARLRHGEPVTSLAFSQDGKWLATAGRDRAIHIWDTATGASLRTIRGDANYPAALALSQDGRFLAANLDGENLLIWEWLQDRPPVVVKAGFAEALGFTTDPKLLFSTEREGVFVRERSVDKPRIAIPEGRSAILNRAGTELIVGTEKGGIAICNIESGKVSRQLEAAHNGAITSVSLAYHGKLLATSDGKKTLVWDLEAGQVLRSFAQGGQVAFLPDREAILVANDGKLTLLDSREKSAIAIPASANMFAISPNGKLLALAGPGNGVRLWDIVNWKDVTPVSHPAVPVTSLAFDTTGQFLLAGDGERLMRWQVAERKAQAIANAPAFALSRSRDGTRVAVGAAKGISFHSWDAIRPVEQMESDQPAVRALALSGDGKQLLFHSSKNTLTLGGADGKTVRRIEINGDPLAVSFAPNGRHAAILGRDGIARLWAIDPNAVMPSDVELWRKRVQRAPTGAVAVSPDGQLVAISSAGRTLIVEAITGRQYLSLERAFGEGDVQALAFSPNGHFLAAGMGGHAGSVRVWEVWTGKVVAQFEGHYGPVNAIAFTPDGRSIASGAGDSTILLWNTSMLTPKSDQAEFATDKAWKQLDELDIAKGQRALRALVSAGPKAAPILRDGLKQAELNQVEIRKWIAQLDDYQFRVREAAKKKLISEGYRALPAIIEARAKKVTPELDERLRSIIDELDMRGVRAAEGTLFGEPLRSVRAVHVLESIGGMEAIAVLELIAKGPNEARSAREARAALVRLRR